MESVPRRLGLRVSAGCGAGEEEIMSRYIPAKSDFEHAADERRNCLARWPRFARGAARRAEIGLISALAAMAIALVPTVSYAGPPHHFGGHAGGHHFGGGHFAGSHFGGSHFGGSHFGGSHFGGSHFGGSHFGGSHFGGGHFSRPHFAGPRAPSAHFDAPHFAGRYAPAHTGDWHGGGGWHGDSRGGFWHGGPRGEALQGDGWRGDGWRGDYDHWHAGWGDWDGPGWGPYDWSGALWLGGYWNGLYWPPVNYSWNYPWFLATIPGGAVTISFGGIPYYYVNRVYYTWSPYYNGYVVANPPPVASSSALGNASTQSNSPADATGVLSLRVIPKKGQSAQQTANDRYACHRWAVAQSGFNPIDSRQDASASGHMRHDYQRAMVACLKARGYRVQ